MVNSEEVLKEREVGKGRQEVWGNAVGETWLGWRWESKGLVDQTG